MLPKAANISHLTYQIVDKFFLSIFWLAKVLACQNLSNKPVRLVVGPPLRSSELARQPSTRAATAAVRWTAEPCGAAISPFRHRTQVALENKGRDKHRCTYRVRFQFDTQVLAGVQYGRSISYRAARRPRAPHVEAHRILIWIFPFLFSAWAQRRRSVGWDRLAELVLFGFATKLAPMFFEKKISYVSYIWSTKWSLFVKFF